MFTCSLIKIYACVFIQPPKDEQQIETDRDESYGRVKVVTLLFLLSLYQIVLYRGSPHLNSMCTKASKESSCTPKIHLSN
jgi:hypothetical protein